MRESTAHKRVIDDVLADLAADARSRLAVTEETALEVARITRRNLADLPRRLGPSEMRRVSAYYRTVLRRTCLRGRGPEFSVPSARIILDAIRADLRAGGWDDAAIHAEVSEHYGELLAQAAHSPAQTAA